MAFGKRQLVLAALVVALGAAVYLNWQFSDHNDLLATNAVESGKELGAAQYVNNPNVSSLVSGQDGATSTSSGAESTTSGTGSGAEYFAQARVSRQQARDTAMDTLKEIINSTQASDAAKTEAVQQTTEIAKNIEQENNIENLVKAKGYPDCVAFIQNGECSIVVSTTDGLLESDAITIKDIVAGQSTIGYDKVKIVEAK